MFFSEQIIRATTNKLKNKSISTLDGTLFRKFKTHIPYISIGILPN